MHWPKVGDVMMHVARKAAVEKRQELSGCLQHTTVRKDVPNCKCVQKSRIEVGTNHGVVGKKLRKKSFVFTPTRRLAKCVCGTSVHSYFCVSK